MEKQIVLILKGLPRSGKSTFAKEIIVNEPGKWKRLNRDSFRLMFSEKEGDRNTFFKDNEKFILKIRDTILDQAIQDGYNVIIDDLNLSEKNITRINQIVNHRAQIIIDDHFLSVSLEELLKRNIECPKEESVPEEVIINLYNQFITKEHKDPYGPFTRQNIKKTIPNYRSYIEGLPDAIICDIDGTVSLMNGRDPFDLDKVDTDIVHEPVRELLNIIYSNYRYQHTHLIFVSGRDDKCKVLTRLWIIDNIISYIDDNADWQLHMRKNNDYRKDAIIKEEIYHEFIENKYNILFVLDDRNQTVEKWRELGLPTFQVGPGNF